MSEAFSISKASHNLIIIVILVNIIIVQLSENFVIILCTKYY